MYETDGHFCLKHVDKSPLRVVSRDLGAVLTFDAVTQKLVHVSIDPSACLWREKVADSDRTLVIDWKHADKVAFGREERPDCRRLVAMFPPTTLGIFNEADLSYTMYYKSGISFKLQLDGLDRFLSFKAKREHPVHMDEYSPFIRSMEISDPAMGVGTVTKYEIYPKEAIRVNGTAWLKLGSGLQEVFSVLGPPEDVYEDYYNFFTSGISVKVNRAKYSCAEKFIIHTNFPGHILFGQYNRALFELSTLAKKKTEMGSISVNNQSSLVDLQQILGDGGQPLVVNSAYTSQVQHFYSFEKHRLNFEFNPSGGIVSVQVM